MSDKPESGSGFLIAMLSVGVASSLAVLLGLWEVSQKSGGEGFYAPNEYLQVQQTAAINTIRKNMAEDFMDTVVNCIPSQTLRDHMLTEQQLKERIDTVIKNFSVLNNNNDRCGNSTSRAWTFTLPCKLAINRPPAWLSGAIKLGDIDICGTSIAESIHSAMGRCIAATDFSGCLVNSVLTNNDVQKEIDKPVDSQETNAQ